jgi:hypothetical protein
MRNQFAGLYIAGPGFVLLCGIMLIDLWWVLMGKHQGKWFFNQPLPPQRGFLLIQTGF